MKRMSILIYKTLSRKKKKNLKHKPLCIYLYLQHFYCLFMCIYYCCNFILKFENWSRLLIWEAVDKQACEGGKQSYCTKYVKCSVNSRAALSVIWRCFCCFFSSLSSRPRSAVIPSLTTWSRYWLGVTEMVHREEIKVLSLIKMHKAFSCCCF